MTWVLDLALQYETESPVPIFGVIVYTDSHPNIKKVLRDKDYWKALDKITGPKWCVFSIRAIEGRFDYTPPQPDTFSKLIPITKEPDQNEELFDLLKIDSTEILPCLVVFIVKNADIMTRTIVPLNDDSTDTAFAKMREIMSLVADALEGVTEENLTNPEGVITAVNFALQNYKDRKVIGQAHKILKEIKTWLPFM